MSEVVSYWLSFLEKRYPNQIELGLDRLETVAERLKLIEFSCPVITVAGTNGKGSTVMCLESIYLAAGYKVGSFTSPYFFHINEEIKIQGVEVDDQALCLAFEIIDKASHGIHLTKFEFITLAALWLFHQRELEILILEVGLGGRLDAVNIVNPDISVITSIALDHTDWLGPDRNSIGREKAGIFRKNRPVVCGEPDPPTSMRDVAQALSVTWYCQNQHFGYQEKEVDWEWYCESCGFTHLPKPTILLQNAATALMVIYCLQGSISISEEAIYQGLRNVRLPGRLEKIERSKSILLDVAHNPAAIALLSQYLDQHPLRGREITVIGMLADKPILECLALLIAQIDIWCIGGLIVKRGASAEEILKKLQTFQPAECYNCGTIEEAFRKACNLYRPGDRIVVFGSFHTVAQVRRLLCK